MRVNLSHAWSPHDWNDAAHKPAAAAPVSTPEVAASAPADSDGEWTLVQSVDDLREAWVTLVRPAGAPAHA
jgi:hypothetical protein